MDVHEMLVVARNEIERGWTQNRLGRPESGGVCARGGLMCARWRAKQIDGLDDIAASALVVQADVQLAAHLPATEAVAIWRVLDVDRAAYGDDWARAICWLVDWNNTPGRTKQEVLDLFDRAIASTAPAPPFGSLGREPATAREPVTEVSV